ncbi:vomeronasal type-1 receptor 90-like [Dasypus novemcinctus]|uniref:vomeronasal type-1 receptor 90-like n=1 Tax=Dasypus novemcinctus TaxID=9361 RepID=UPI0003288446|nr:putative vomeronasal receptor-like protein 4 [Dasypus novemcinctus]
MKNWLVSETVVGISANTFLLLFRMFTLLQDCRPKSTDVTVCHLAFVHIGMLLSMAFLVFTNMFGSQRVQDDVTCKALLYMARIMRGLSICTTCQLSVLQAITTSPSSSRLAKFKFIPPHDIVHFFLFTWFLNMSLCSHLLVYAVSSSNMSGCNLMFVSECCSFSLMSSIIRSMLFILSLFREVAFVGVMLLSSAYTVILSYRHKTRSQHLHSTRFSPRHSPEKQAAQTILLLLSLFVLVYWVELITFSFPLILRSQHPVIWDVFRLLVNAYTTASPLVLISSDKSIAKVLQHMLGKNH